ncbi:MAG: hypothetical protein CMJ83_10230 [Planctomycetes bacterium]|nr:hypothetical protein [Planctomycetota bacterium]
MFRTLSCFVAIALCAAPAGAQLCPAAGQTFWSRDSIPQNPGSNPTGVSIIQGMCEGEAAAVVFELPPGMPPQRLTQVVCPMGSPGGANGAVALVNLEVYDGTSFSGPTVSIGNPVFNLNSATGNDLQVTSHGLNTLDVSQYNIDVGNDPANRRFTVAFRLTFNPNGTCATGYQSSLFTDNSAAPFGGCNPAITPSQTSLIDILGQGWVDVTVAQVTGFPLCPLFYAGVWVIRACSIDAPPANPFQIQVITPLPATSPGNIAMNFIAPSFDGYPYVAAASFATSPGIPTPFGTVPLAIDPLFQFSTSPAAAGIFINFTGNFLAGGTALALINIPAGVSGLSFNVAFVGIPTTGAPWGISDPLPVAIQ